MKVKKVAASLMAAAAFFISMGSTVVSADPTTQSPTPGTSAEVKITKELKLPEGVTVPNATFKFTFDAQSATSVPITDIPVIGEKSVTYAGSDTETNYTGSIKKVTGDIFAGVNYTATGQYVYHVKETPNTYTPIKDTVNNVDIDRITYDKSEYDMYVFVKEHNGTYYIFSVYFKQTHDSNGNPITPGAKVDKDDDTGGYKLFTNIYTKDAGKIDPTDPDPSNPTNPDATKKSLTISKTVTSATGLGDENKDFTFNLTFTAPNDYLSTTYAGTKTAKDGSTSQITFTAGTAQSFALKHGEKLEFDTLPSGIRYEVTETGTQNYTPSAVITSNGVTTNLTGTKGDSLAMPSTGTILIGEKTNSNAVTNKFEDDDITPTGLLINNLPFVVLIGLGVTGFIALTRKRHQN